ncbi:ParA family protein [Nitrosomonas sp. sh817]|uniref:ParA family protein n=1 Tax=Nitrosomonas sp. sh817 TaxID=3070658 RepID=UPI0027DCE249|nr:AAA family ATPase [Nitrosomonas sp. sh817]WMJ09212.1 AAA family ATPase [Nitrosomonas sp. sh817]
MKVLSVFNNKGGVGKTTLTFHLSHALSEIGYKVLMIDADPQCNLTIYSIAEEKIHDIWEKEDSFIDLGMDATKKDLTERAFDQILNSPRSLHFIVKSTEEGTGELSKLPPPFKLTESLDIIPGRLSLHTFEEAISKRWPDVYRGDPLAIRTLTRIRSLANEYTSVHQYDFVIVDTSPSLGVLNKVIISTVDGFFIPALPDIFSLYGIRNIGKALSVWKTEFDILYKLLSEDKRKAFPAQFVSFLGYTIYNAKPYSNSKDGTRGLAKAHSNYAEKIPSAIKEYIKPELRNHLTDQLLGSPIGDDCIMYTHNTFPAMAQKYHMPMWKVPSNAKKEPGDSSTLAGARQKYEDTKDSYKKFATELLKRVELLS